MNLHRSAHTHHIHIGKYIEKVAKHRQYTIKFVPRESTTNKYNTERSDQRKKSICCTIKAKCFLFSWMCCVLCAVMLLLASASFFMPVSWIFCFRFFVFIFASNFFSVFSSFLFIFINIITHPDFSIGTKQKKISCIMHMRVFTSNTFQHTSTFSSNKKFNVFDDDSLWFLFICHICKQNEKWRKSK